MTNDRLDELATYRPDDDTPDDAKVRIPVGDLRDLVALIPVARKHLALVAVCRAQLAELGVDFDNPLADPPERKVTNDV